MGARFWGAQYLACVLDRAEAFPALHHYIGSVANQCDSSLGSPLHAGEMERLGASGGLFRHVGDSRLRMVRVHDYGLSPEGSGRDAWGGAQRQVCTAYPCSLRKLMNITAPCFSHRWLMPSAWFVAAYSQSFIPSTFELHRQRKERDNNERKRESQGEAIKAYQPHLDQTPISMLLSAGSFETAVGRGAEGAEVPSPGKAQQSLASSFDSLPPISNASPSPHPTQTAQDGPLGVGPPRRLPRANQTVSMQKPLPPSFLSRPESELTLATASCCCPAAPCRGWK